MVKKKFEDLKANRDRSTSSSDICEHLETLAKYSKECKHITEFWVRSVVSTYAFLYWMPKDWKLVSYDIEYHPNIHQCYEIVQRNNLDWVFVVWDTREINIEGTDLLFIDTLHNGDLLEIELERHWNKSNKYIIFHDTTTFGERWEECGHPWLNWSINNFLAKNKHWAIKEIFTNNNWLTILERKKPAETIVYTAIFGNKDILKKQPQQTIPVSFVCFTDDPNIECEDWAKEQREIRVIQPHKHLHPRMQAKYFRMHPTDFLEAKTIIWMDWSARLLRDDSIEHFMSQFLVKKSDILCFQHPERNCIYDEAEFCKYLWKTNTIEKYKWLSLQEQVGWYKDKWFPKDYWLTATGLLITKSDNIRIKDFFHKWRTECLEWTYQDQLSFDYLVWKEWIKRQWLQENLWINDYIDFRNQHIHIK